VCINTPHSVPSNGVILCGTSRHNTMLITAHTITNNDDNVGEIAILTMRRMGGNTGCRITDALWLATVAVLYTALFPVGTVLLCIEEAFNSVDVGVVTTVLVLGYSAVVSWWFCATFVFNLYAVFALSCVS
jgi:hypothetical protein